MIKRLLVLLTATAVFSMSANAATILSVDLSVLNQVTISTTSGTSSVTASGFDSTGFLLASIFDGVFAGTLGDTLISGDLTSAENTSDGTPDLFVFSGNAGLNVWSYTDDATGEFVAGSLAFSGSATWDISADSYASLLAGALSGDVYFPADDDGDLATAMVIGQWERATPVPVPAAVWLMMSALGGLGLMRRR